MSTSVADTLGAHQPAFPLPASPAMLFRLFPEWVVVVVELSGWLFIVLCHTHYFSNPYLVSKLVEFEMNLYVQ